MSTNRIVYGDSRKKIPQVVDRPINCVVADPPYGVNYQSRMATTPRGKEIVADIKGDKDLAQAILEFHTVMDVVVPRLADEADLYFFTRWDIVDTWMAAVRRLPGINYKMLLVWEKGDPGMGDIDANWGCGHELILYCKKGRRDVARRRSGVLHFERVPAGHMIHPTEKPVPLIEELVTMSAKRGDLVVDPYSGSGSTAVACQRLGIDSFSFESDKKWIPRSRERLTQVAMF